MLHAMSAQGSDSPATSAERRIVLGVVLATAGSMFCNASFNFVIHPIVTGLNASETQSDMLRQLPGIGGLLAIFVTGVLVMRVGPQRCLKWVGILMCVGFSLTLIAPSMPVLTLGLLLGQIGAGAVMVITVSILSSSLRSTDARTSAFATFAMVTPAVCVLIPLVASYTVDALGWRWVSFTWILGALLVVFAAVRLTPSDDAVPRQRGELWTPVLAGMTLVGLTQVVRLAATDGLVAPAVLAAMAVTAASLIALVALMRRLSQPSMTWSLFRDRNLALLMIVVVILPFSNMWFYGTVGAQYIYGLSTFEVSLIFIPVQLGGVVGAILGGRLVRARGLTFSGTTTILITAAMCFLCLVQTTTIPLIVPLIILIVFGAAANATMGTLTNAVMSLAPKGSDGETSAYRTAAMSLGSSLGAVFLSAIVFTTMSSSISAQSAANGLSPQQADEIAQAMLDGATSEQVSAQYSTPITQVDEVESYQPQAAVEGYWAQGVGGGTMILLAGGIYYFTRRRIDRREAVAPVDPVASA